MNSEEVVDDPFKKLIETFSVLENENRAICLISLYIGEKTDSNTIKGILDIFNKLKGEENTPGKLRGYLTSFVNAGLIERETEKIIGNTKVSFHQITTLGIIGVLYLCFNLIENPNELDWDLDELKEKSSNDEVVFIRYITDKFIKSIKSPAKVINLVGSGSKLSKLKVNPLDINLPISLSKENTFKVFEEILYNYLLFSPSLSKELIEQSLDGEKAIKYFKRLGNLVIEEKLGKITYFSLSNRGLFVLPIINLFIRELAIDKSILDPLILANIDEEGKPWILLTKRSIHLFKRMFRIEEVY